MRGQSKAGYCTPFGKQYRQVVYPASTFLRSRYVVTGAGKEELIRRFKTLGLWDPMARFRRCSRYQAPRFREGHLGPAARLTAEFCSVSLHLLVIAHRLFFQAPRSILNRIAHGGTWNSGASPNQWSYNFAGQSIEGCKYGIANGKTLLKRLN